MTDEKTNNNLLKLLQKQRICEAKIKEYFDLWHIDKRKKIDKI